MRAIAALGGCVLFTVFAFASYAADPEKWEAEGGCPTIEHVPITQVVRGTPAVVSAIIQCPGGRLTEVTLQIRLIDGGQPTAQIKMTGAGDGAYQASVPVSMVQGVTRFWYYIDARAATASGQESYIQTGWKPVNIISYKQTEQAAGATGGVVGGSEAGGKEDDDNDRPAWFWLAGGVAVAGGAVALGNNSDSDGGDEEPPAGSSAPPARSEGTGQKNRESKPAPCSSAGRSDAALLGETSPCAGSGALDVAVCGLCPGAVVSVVSSWGAIRQRTSEAEVPCDFSLVPTIKLPRPDYIPTSPESETISVFVNGALIKELRWPSAEELAECDLDTN